MSFTTVIVSLLGLASAASYTVDAAEIGSRSAAEPYAPYSVSCPIRPRTRPAVSLSVEELGYVLPRELKADAQLKQWLGKTLGQTEAFNCEMPRIALALSGGGPKAGLTTAGAVQALDARDSPNGVGGLLQSMTYMSALSGGSLTLSGIMTNDFSKISTLKTNLYNQNYQNPFALPLAQSQQIQTDVDAKVAAGYRSSLVDPYGRAISYDYIGGTAGGNGITWSNVTTQLAFKAHEAPYPIITLTDTDYAAGQCFPNYTGPIWELGPYDFGSWDPTVDAFYPTTYLGTPQNASRGLFGGSCTKGFDNAGFFTGVSSNILASGQACSSNGTEPLSVLGEFVLAGLSTDAEPLPYGIVPNPFYKDTFAGLIRQRKYLYMLDGGDTGQGIPLFPFLQPERQVDVIFAIDAESSAATNITTGSSLYRTYVAAHMMGLTKMPVVPDSPTFLAQNLSAHATFFGCNDTQSATVIFIPNTPETGYASSNFFLTPTDIDNIFNGGIEMATQFNDSQWPTCVACAILHKQVAGLPDVCNACLQKYCWKG